MPDRLHIVTRRDIPAGVAAAQVVHASRELVDRFREQEAKWRDESNTVSILTVENEACLYAIRRRVVDKSLPFAEFREPDLGGELTAIAILGGASLVRGLPLFLS